MSDRFSPIDVDYWPWISWVEETYEEYEANTFVDDNFTSSQVEVDWLNKLFAKDYSPEKAAQIISRAYRMFSEKVELVCPYCEGKGAITHPHLEPCIECEATGKINTITFKLVPNGE